jgi:osmotically-inducible protein OsmY
VVTVPTKEDVLNKVRAALRSEPRLDLHRFPVALDFDAGVLTLDGEMPNVAAKKLALGRTAALGAVTGIIDRLRVVPASHMGDNEIRQHIRDALLQEPALRDCTIRERVKGEVEIVREPADASLGTIEIKVEGGVVTLDGDLPSLARKRLAGVLAWWVPGSRDVVNGLGVTPPEDDSDDEIADAVRIVLEKDPFVDAGQIRVGVRRAAVTLVGLVPTDSEREMAEFDAWYVFGVDKVVNNIEVHA